MIKNASIPLKKFTRFNFSDMILQNNSIYYTTDKLFKKLKIP